MISGDFAYYGINLLLVLAAVASLFLLPKLISDRSLRRKLVVSAALLLLSSLVFAVSLRFFRLQSLAYMGAALGRIDQEKFNFVDRFKTVALLGNVLELLAVAFLASIVRALPIRGSGGDSGKGGA